MELVTARKARAANAFEVLNLVGVTRSTLYRWMEAGTFPKQIHLGPRTIVWNEREVVQWMEDRMAAR